MTTQNPLPTPEYPFPAAEAASSRSAAPTPPPQPDKPWQSMYQAERKKARVLGATTVAASLLAVGLGAWELNAQGSSAASGPGQFGGPNATSQVGPPGMNGNSSPGGTDGATGTLPGGPGAMGQDLASTLLNSDGSVNTDAVARFVQQVPAGALDQILAMAVGNGELTQEQADQITEAAGSATTSGTNAQDT